jgi:hypothetical protein
LIIAIGILGMMERIIMFYGGILFKCSKAPIDIMEGEAFDSP